MHRSTLFTYRGFTLTLLGQTLVIYPDNQVMLPGTEFWSSLTAIFNTALHMKFDVIIFCAFQIGTCSISDMTWAVTVVTKALRFSYIVGLGLGYRLRFGFQTHWLHCTVQNTFTLHRL